MHSTEFEEHLQKKIIPFWNRLKDETYGGFYGEMDINLATNQKADKGLILHGRILWFYSNLYLLYKDPSYLSMADHTYDFIKQYGVDTQFNGIYWMLSYDGKPTDTTKHTYNQAFAIYALSSYYAASGKKESLDLAYQLFELIEHTCKDDRGYLEAFNRTYDHLIDNDKLSENGVMATRTMNTLLHVFEAYCELYRVDHNAKVADAIYNIFRIMYERIYFKDKEQLGVFFDDDYNSLIDLHSYGHDIEASWLIDRGLEILKEPIDEDLYQKMHDMVDVLVQKIYVTAYDAQKHAVNAECECGKVATQKIWWTQAESVIGFYNAYERMPYHDEYRIASENIWQYILDEIVDPRPDGEWFQEKDSPQGANLPMVSPWKCPYHNGRMCIEMIRRLRAEEKKTTPVNPNASKEACDLLKKLGNVRGNHIITGQHTQTNPMEEIAYIYKTTGKKPLLQGFELLGYSPNINEADASTECLTEVYENRGTMKTALSWAKETGGIVTMTFHWFSPVGGRDKSFYAKNTDFDANQILIEGTKERTAFYSDLDVIAKELRIFENEHIPIIWRPFHEADGDWFWWGHAGDDCARKLYRLMYDYYVNELHINNLIWAWSSPSRFGYPGDDCVDLVTRDIYLPEYQATDYQKEHRELILNTSRNKITALGEVGYIPDIELLRTTKIPWTYYMSWSKEFCIGEQYNSVENVTNMYHSDYALTLSD